MPFLTQGKTNWKYILIVLILAIIVGGGILIYQHRWLLEKETKMPGIEASKVISLNETWNKYTNHKLGFSINIPKNVTGVNRCESFNKFLVPVKVFEDEIGIVYISHEYYYDAEWDNELGKFTGPCEKITYSLESLRNEGEPFLGWAIMVKTVENNSDLNNFIKERFGSACSLDIKNPSKEHGKGYYDVKAKSGGMESNCPLNYAYKILYVPEKNKAMAVVLDQECTFFIKNPNSESELYYDECYDLDMIASFKFEPLEGQVLKEITPEEVATGFFNWYIKEGGASRIAERNDITEEYKQKIIKSIEAQFMVDPVIFAQAGPDQGFSVGEAEIQENKAFLIVNLRYSGSELGHYLRVEFVKIDNQWKINNVTFFEKEIVWKTYRNEEYKYEVKHPEGWYFIEDRCCPSPPEGVTLSNCPKKEEICSYFDIDIISDTGDGNLDNIKEVELLKSEKWDYEYTTVGEMEAIKIVRPCPTMEGACTAPELTRYYIIKGNYTYRIEFKTRYDGCRICDQILPTFRFLE